MHGIPFDFNQEYYIQAVERCGGLEQLYVQYYAQQLDLIEQCRPEILGHLDLVKIFSNQVQSSGFAFPEEIYHQIHKNIEAVISYGGIFEVNTRSFVKGMGEPYPGIEILRRIKDMGGEITLGDDSHGLDDIGNQYETTLEYLKKIGFQEVLAFRKKDPFNKDMSKPMACLEKIRLAL
ncbi:MAG: histidinol-phosphatase HisJ family protein [Candidatus Electrothrix sp. AR3]|nr:histidinol-phosphatase HisJ family protein [Candidatus Electrothrix sp. AR3]